MKSAVLLLLNGELSDLAALKRLARGAGGVICADGGARHAARLKIEPRFVVGDMDSLPRPLPRWKRTVYWCDFNPALSDFEKSLRFAAGIGCRKIFVAGVLGGRLDHCLVNLSVAQRYAEKMDLEIVDRGRARLLGPGRHRLEAARGARVSLLSASPRARVSASGLFYPLARTVLTPGSLGLSNRATGPAAVTVHSGRVWLMT